MKEGINGVVLPRIADTILRDQRSVLTGSAATAGVEAACDATMSSPHSIGGNGVPAGFPPPLTEAGREVLVSITCGAHSPIRRLAVKSPVVAGLLAMAALTSLVALLPAAGRGAPLGTAYFLQAGPGDEGFRRVTEPRVLSFPDGSLMRIAIPIWHAQGDTPRNLHSAGQLPPGGARAVVKRNAVCAVRDAPRALRYARGAGRDKGPWTQPRAVRRLQANATKGERSAGHEIPRASIFRIAGAERLA